MSIEDVSLLIPPKIRDKDLWVKVSEMMQFIVDGFEDEINDVKSKWTDPASLDDDAIKEIIAELGFGYIRDVMDTITNFQFNTLLQYLSLINLLKGSREGYELVLRLLGFDSIIAEWWEQSPEGEPWTFEVTIIVNTSNVPDIFETLDKVQIFTEHYVFPKISNIDFRFDLDTFAERAIVMAGFVKQTYATKTGEPILRRAQ